MQAILDFETLDTTAHAVVDELGILVFDERHWSIAEEIAIRLDIGEQLALGRTTSADTINHRRKNSTYPTHFQGEALDIALSRIQLLMHDHQPSILWIWGKDFDRPILDSLFDSVGRLWRFRYSRIRCARDLYKDAFGDDAIGSDKSHHAIEDCRVILHDIETARKHLRNHRDPIPDLPPFDD
jgi:hypothetical protein